MACDLGDAISSGCIHGDHGLSPAGDSMRHHPWFLAVAIVFPWSGLMLLLLFAYRKITRAEPEPVQLAEYIKPWDPRSYGHTGNSHQRRLARRAARRKAHGA